MTKIRIGWAAGIFLALLAAAGCGKQTPLPILKWVALGDSLTEGYRPLPETTFPNRIQVLSQKDRLPVDCVRNLAGGGHTITQLRRLQLPRVEHDHPDIVSLWIGTNDILGNFVTGKPPHAVPTAPLDVSEKNFEQDLIAVLDAVEQLKIKYIFLGKIHDLSVIPIAQILPRAKREELKKWVGEYNQIIERAAKQYPNVRLVPLDELPSLTNPQCYWGDGIHPRPEDNEEIAKAFWKVMRAALRG